MPSAGRRLRAASSLLHPMPGRRGGKSSFLRSFISHWTGFFWPLPWARRKSGFFMRRGSVDEENLSVITSRIGIVRKICDELHLPVELEAVRGAPKVDAGRRRFFSKLSAALEPQDTSSPQTQEMRSRIAKTLLEEAFVRIPEGRLRLIHALKRLLEKSGKPDSREAAKLFSAPRIDAAKCSGCALCPAVCPTGALQSQGEGGTLRLLLNAGACTGCRLCADICFMNAVTASRRSVARRSLIDASENAFLPKERRPGVRHLGRQARRHDQRAGLSDMSALQTRPAARASAKRL